MESLRQLNLIVTPTQIQTGLMNFVFATYSVCEIDLYTPYMSNKIFHIFKDKTLS